MDISNGRYVEFNFNNTMIEFKSRNNSDISNISKIVATVIQAIKATIKDKIIDNQIENLRNKLLKEKN